MSQFGHIVLSIYIHHEYYPPTLHAITSLAGRAESVTVVTRNLADPSWQFPRNVVIKVSGKRMSLDQSMKQPFSGKVRSFLQYVALLHRTIVHTKPEIVVLHDPIALFGYWLVGGLKRIKYRIWYHNHDVIEPGSMRRFSITWFAEKFQIAAFRKVDIFTLPTMERRLYFPELEEGGVCKTVNNFPSRLTYGHAYSPKLQPKSEIKLLYQGVIRPGHGMEEVVNILDCQILGLKVSLTIIGDIDAEYKRKLSKLAESGKVESQLVFMDRIAYRDLPYESCNYDIGLAIHRVDNIQYSTGGLASNKIYEYAALGLPVLYYDTAHYNLILKDYDWAYPVTLDREEIIKVLHSVVNNYAAISEAAHKCFADGNNFEHSFLALLEELDPGLAN